MSGGGKFNYQGTKRWLEDNLDHTGEVWSLGGAVDTAGATILSDWSKNGFINERFVSPLLSFSFSSDSSLLQDNVAFVLCLDTVGNGDSLHLHVSKPPKEGSPQYSLLKELEMVRTDDHKRITVYVCVCFFQGSI